MTALSTEQARNYRGTHTAGRSPEELVGQSAFAFMHPEDVAPMRSKLEAALAQPGQPVTATYRMQHRDGSWRVVEG